MIIGYHHDAMEVSGSCAADVIRQATILDFVDLAERVPKDHPLRTIKTVADEALDRLAPEFERMYSKVGRASVPPERLLKAS